MQRHLLALQVFGMAGTVRFGGTATWLPQRLVMGSAGCTVLHLDL
jgi:hypothetical protein